MKTPRFAYQKGLALVEFSIMLPLLLLLLLGTAEFGRLFIQYDELVKQTRDGARYLAEHASTGTTGVTTLTDEAIAQTRNLVVYGNINGNGELLIEGVTPACIDISTGAAGHIRVSATFTYTPILFPQLPLFGLGEPISLTLPLTSSSMMRVL